MPPNLGGFFMVRSYYPSECHADYFDFERIEALKPAIEACGISTLSRSEERFSRNAETDLVCRLLLEKKKSLRPQSQLRGAQGAKTLSVDAHAVTDDARAAWVDVASTPS